MKKSIFIALFAVSLIGSFYSCSNSSSKTPAIESKAEAQVVYTCPMHPEVLSDKPGTCPKCGMDLVKKETADTTRAHSQVDTSQKH